MIAVYTLLVCLCVAAVAIFLMLRTQKATATSLTAKTFASLLFVIIGALGLLWNGNSVIKILIVLGLVCGLIGDILLDNKVMYPQDDSAYLTAGTTVFGIGHVLYFLALLVYAIKYNLTGFGWVVLSAFVFSLIVSAIIICNGRVLKLDFGCHAVQMYFYNTILLFMVLVSICASFASNLAIILAVGFVLFYASDLVLSQQYFGGKANNKTLTIINHVLYYLAQILIATFAVFV